jgi:hypothetical protein
VPLTQPELPLTPDELRTALALTFGEGATRPDGYAVATCGVMASAVEGARLADYAEAGATWWLETLPLDATPEEARRRLAAGPPRD